MDPSPPSEPSASPVVSEASSFGRQTDAFVAEADARLRAIESAVAAVDAGSYGRCEICDGEISAERLAARASERRCAEHEGAAISETRLF